MSHSAKPSISFFGGTGGSTLACLDPAIRHGYRCTALARSPQKLRDLLTGRGVPENAIDNNLTIVTGNVNDMNAVKQVIINGSRPVDLIISGIGGKLLMTNPLWPTLDNPTVCQDALSTILQALRDLKPPARDKMPTLIVLSTTGISDKARDLPYAMMPLYHWMLRVPHDDKKVMERSILDEMGKPNSQRTIHNYTIVRPSLLTDGNGVGPKMLRVGVEKKPAIGYTIARNDVGEWLFENVVQKNNYLGEIVTITS